MNETLKEQPEINFEALDGALVAIFQTLLEDKREEGFDRRVEEKEISFGDRRMDDRRIREDRPSNNKMAQDLTEQLNAKINPENQEWEDVVDSVVKEWGRKYWVWDEVTEGVIAEEIKGFVQKKVKK